MPPGAISARRAYWARLEAVQRLGRLALPPCSVLEAENALHAVLLSVAEGGESQLQAAVEEQLRDCWEDSGDGKVWDPRRCCDVLRGECGDGAGCAAAR